MSVKRRAATCDGRGVRPVGQGPRLVSSGRDAAAVLEKIESLAKHVERLQQRVEDLEDLRDLQAAIAENANEPLLPWDKAKAELEIE